MINNEFHIYLQFVPWKEDNIELIVVWTVSFAVSSSACISSILPFVFDDMDTANCRYL